MKQPQTFRTPIFLVLLVLLIASAFNSCRSPEKLLQLAQDRGAVIVPDTAWQTRTIIDTIRDPETGQIQLIERVDSIPYPVEVLKYVPMSRQERKALKDEYKHAERMLRLQIKEKADSLRFLDKELKRIANNYGDSLRYERDKVEAAEKTAQKGAKGSIFWTWIGKRWWILLLIGFLLRQFLPIILKLFGINWPLKLKK